MTRAALRRRHTSTRTTGLSKESANDAAARSANVPSRQFARWVAIALACAALAAYAVALRAPFQFDDIASIPGNATIRSLAPISVPLSPPSNTSVAGRPVVNYSLALNYALNEWLGVDQRPNPEGVNKTLGYHAFNLLIHIACGLLLFGSLRRTLRSWRLRERWAGEADWFAAVVATLWLLHPIQTEAVNYLIQRTELIVSVCYLGTLYSAIRAWDASSRRAAIGWRTVAVIVCLLGMASKEVMITAPIIVVLYDRAFRVRSWRELATGGDRSWFYGLLACTSALVIALVASNARFDTVGFGLGISWYGYLYSQAWAILHYLRLVAWPDQLTFDYGQRPIIGLRGVPGLVVLSAFAAATIVAWTRVERWGWFGFLGAWFFLTLAPSSSVVPITTEIAAERRIYLALAAVIALIVVALEASRRRLAAEWGARPPWAAAAAASIGVFYLIVSAWTADHTVPNRVFTQWTMRFAIAVAAAALAWVMLRGMYRRSTFAAIVLVLMGVTAARSMTYTNAEGLWRDTVLKAPSNPRAYDNLAFNLFFDDPPGLAEAKELYWKAIALDPTYLHAWPGLASIAVDEDHPDEAVWLLQRALAINPQYADAIDHLGKLYLKTGQPERAVPYLVRFAASYPSDTSFVPLARAYMAIGRLDDAASALTNALNVNPSRVDAAQYLGGIFVEQARGREAIPLLERVASVNASGVTLGLLSVAYAQVGRTRDAIETAKVASERSGGDASVFTLAGRAMLLANRPADADMYLSQAVSISPLDPDALTRLGTAKLTLGRHEKAIQLFRRALAIDPRYTPAQEGLRSAR